MSRVRQQTSRFYFPQIMSQELQQHPDLYRTEMIQGTGCGDPRPMSLINGFEHIHQFFGGGAGLGLAGLAAVAARNRDYAGEITVGGFTRAMNEIAASKGHLLVAHYACAFINNMEAIAEKASDPDFLVAGVQAVDRTVDADKVVAVAGGFRLIRDSGAITEAHRTIDDLILPSGRGRIVPVQTPEQESHNSRTILHPDDPQVAFSAKRAIARNAESYVHNGATTRTVGKILGNEFSIDQDIFDIAGQGLMVATHATLEEKTGHSIELIHV